MTEVDLTAVPVVHPNHHRPGRTILTPPAFNPVFTDPDVPVFRQYLRGHHPPDGGHQATAKLPQFLWDWVEVAQVDYRNDAKQPLEKTDLAVASAAVEYAAMHVLPECPQFDGERLQERRSAHVKSVNAGVRHPDDGPRWTAPFEDNVRNRTVGFRLRSTRTWSKVAPLTAVLGGNKSAVLRHLMGMAFAHYDDCPVMSWPNHRGTRKAMEYAERLLERVDRVDRVDG